MTLEPESSVYHLGHHTLEITQERTLMIVLSPSEERTITELVQLDRDEAYNLYISLHALFQSDID